MKSTRRFSIVAAGLAGFGLMGGALAAEPQIVFKLNGKAVTAVPVDQLGALSVSVNTGGMPFRNVYDGQWSGIDQNVNLVVASFPEDDSPPDLSGSNVWKGSQLAATSLDSNWGGTTTLTGSMLPFAKDTHLESITTDKSLVFSSRFRRRVYTGKTVWQNNGWVQETRWETVGRPLGQAVLKLEPPTFARELNAAALSAGAKPSKEQVERIVQGLLYPDSHSGQKATFDGSEIQGMEPISGQKPLYNWYYNYSTSTSFVKVAIPMKVKIHASMQLLKDPLPVPIQTSADFVFPASLVANHPPGKGTWQFADLNPDNDYRLAARTPDGKTADDVIGAAEKPGSGASDPALDATKAMLKGFGF